MTLDLLTQPEACVSVLTPMATEIVFGIDSNLFVSNYRRLSQTHYRRQSRASLDKYSIWAELMDRERGKKNWIRMMRTRLLEGCKSEWAG